MRINDARGATLTFERPPSRVVSLVPSITESLAELGAGTSIVGRTDYCIFPPSISSIPAVGGTKTPRIDEIRALMPDLVHVNLEENLRRHAEEIETFAPVFASEPRSPDDVGGLLLTLGEIHGCTKEASAHAARIRELASELAGRQRFTFACAIWKDPWMWCGGDTYVSGLVSAAGGLNVLQDERRYPRLSPEDVASARPDVVFLPDEPFAFVTEDAASLSGLFRRVVGPFPGHLFTWHGTRTVRGLEFLREL